MSINPQTGLVYWQPGRDQVGSYRVTVEAFDANGATDTQTYTLTVSDSAGATPPKFTSTPPKSIGPGDPFDYQPTVSAAAGDVLTYSLPSGPNISPTDRMTIDPMTGEVTWAPRPGDYGQRFLVTIQVADNQGLSDTQQFDLQVGDPANHPPTFTSDPVRAAAVGQLYAYQAAATNLDNDPLAFDLPVHPAGMLISPDGRIYWVPTADEVGAQGVIARVRDGRGGVDLQPYTITVAAADTPPIITSAPTGQPEVGYTYEYRVLAQDAENDPLTYALSPWTPAPAGMLFDPTRPNVLEWTPQSAGPATVTIVVSDGRGGTASQSITLTAIAPQKDGPPTITSTPRDSIATGLTYVYQVVATDPDGDHLTYVLDTPLAGLSLDPASGLMKWTPTSDQVGAHPLAIHVDDGRMGSIPQTFTVTVTASLANSAPTITSRPITNGVADEVYAYDPTATDPDHDALTWSLVQAPAGLSINPATGTLRWLPGQGQVGSYPIQVEVSDPYGGSAIQPYTLTIRGTGTPPVITSTAPSPATVNVPYIYAVLADDGYGDPLRYRLDQVIDESTGRPYPGIWPSFSADPAHPNLLRWVPATAGTYDLTVVVDGPGGRDMQTCPVVVSAAPPDNTPPPTITSDPVTYATTAATYQYLVTASDPAATFSLSNATQGWWAIDPATGRMQSIVTVHGVFPPHISDRLLMGR